MEKAEGIQASKRSRPKLEAGTLNPLSLTKHFSMLTEDSYLLDSKVDLFVVFGIGQFALGLLTITCCRLVMRRRLGFIVHFTVHIANVTYVDMLPFFNGYTIADRFNLIFMNKILMRGWWINWTLIQMIWDFGPI
jgi:hypothetical protein